MCRKPAPCVVALALLLSVMGCLCASDDNRCNIQNKSKQTICASATYTTDFQCSISGCTDPDTFTDDGVHNPFRDVCITPGNSGKVARIPSLRLMKSAVHVTATISSKFLILAENHRHMQINHLLMNASEDLSLFHAILWCATWSNVFIYKDS